MCRDGPVGAPGGTTQPTTPAAAVVEPPANAGGVGCAYGQALGPLARSREIVRASGVSTAGLRTRGLHYCCISSDGLQLSETR